MDYESMHEIRSTVIVAPPSFIPKIVIRKQTGPQRTIPKKKKVVLQVKSHAHPWSTREDLSDAFELPASQRENWWRYEMKVTPVPGRYESTDFLEELGKRPNTYNFKSEGRKKLRDYTRTGLFLLPGGYEHQDFITNLSQKPATYRFKAGERFATDVLNFGLKDKDVNVPPNAYSTQNYLAIAGEQYPQKSSLTRYQTKRIPSDIFRLKDGPAPGTYNVKDIASTIPAITSCFKSKIPRFHQQHTKIPGPGERWDTLQSLMPATNIGQLRGLFFTTGFETK